MKKILIYILIFIASLLYCAEKTSVEGKLITNGKKWFIKNETGFYILNLAPNEWFEEKNIILEADKTVKAIGELKDKELYVNVLFIDNEICVMRDGQSNPLWKPQIKYPGPIPNPEAKPLIADNTAGFTCGNVGRCLVDSVFLFFYFQFLFY